MKMFKTARNWVLCGIIIIGSTYVSAQNSNTSMQSAASWGNSGYVNDYYYGEQSAFELDDNMFNYGSTATQNMGSTSSCDYSPGAISTAASNIVAGSTLAGYQAQTVARAASRGGRDHQWETDDSAPIGDGWDVMLLLCLMAVAYGVRTYVRTRMRADNK